MAPLNEYMEPDTPAEYELRYFIINKPFGMVSQFVSSHRVKLLGDLGYPFPEGIHAIGRLDSPSEGLLLLTTDKRVTKLLFQGEVPHKRTYLVQVKGVMGEEALQQLRQGVTIRTGETDEYLAIPTAAELVTKPEGLFERRKSYSERAPTSWVLITLTEGKFRQVRKMVAGVGHGCCRLIRMSIEDMELGQLQPGEVCELDAETFYGRLKIEMPKEPYVRYTEADWLAFVNRNGAGT